MTVVVSDTGPILHLTEAAALGLLRHVGNVCVPEAVADELRFRLPGGHLPEWIETLSLAASFAAQARAWQQAGLLDPGEAEAITLVQQTSAQWLLTDDAAARVFAESLGMEVHGSLGVVLWAAAEEHLEHYAAADTLNRLARFSLWISPRILQKAHTALDEICRR